jgi:hypothetical protein
MALRTGVLVLDGIAYFGACCCPGKSRIVRVRADTGLAEGLVRSASETRR